MPKQVFQRIIQGTQKPSKDSAIKLAFALDIEVYKITYFLELAGYTLCNTDTRDMILEYCFITQKTINEIDEILCKYNQKPLFKKE